jgi:hypothetical protein
MPAMPAQAALSPPGVNIRWDQCFVDGGTANKVFACDTNSGSDRLVASFVVDREIPDVRSIAFNIGLASASASWPAWWGFRSVGTCRQFSLALEVVPPPGSVNCSDWASGLASGGISFAIGNMGLNTALVSGETGTPSAATLEPDVEYFVGTLVINHAKTVGTGACGGCDVPVCVIFSQLTVSTSNIANDLWMWNGANWEGSQIASWQNSYVAGTVISSVNPGAGAPQHKSITSCVPYSTSPTRLSTWGAVKSLYR